MSLRCSRLFVLGFLFATAAPLAAAAADKPAKLDADHAKKMKRGLALFKARIRPVLIRECWSCHGGREVNGELDFSSRKTMLNSKAVARTAQASRLMKLLNHEEKPHMPRGRAQLSAKIRKDFATWIDLGAPFDKPLTGEKIPIAGPPPITQKDRDFWSFRPLRDIVPPAVKNKAWLHTDIDRFVLAKLEQQGLKPNSTADRRTLIRRATFDLTGLPPTRKEIDAFVNDRSPRAYERMIDRLLASPRYGERWARHWMDVSRFAESHGYEQDYDRPNAYTYRDFLIRAHNSDMPFDQFIRWQIAGDEIAPDNPLALTATGFLGAGAFPTQLTEAEFESSRYDELDDMVATTGVAFLGLSVGCARCHDHKYDPISSHDYYRLAATFTTAIRAEVDLQLPGSKKKTKAQITSEGFPHMKHHADGRGFPHFYPKTYMLSRGDVKQKVGEVQSGYLRVLMRGGKDQTAWKAEPPANWKRTSYRRTGLARWITDVRHGAGHLAARVIVNRVWQHHFGRGIVATPNDFGAQGSTPTHPLLLDWLALDFVRHGWKLKRLHKLIMTSSVYMQSIDSDAARGKRDPTNTLLWRRVPRRLEAEAVRDSLLAVSGMLDTTMYGPGTLNEAMKRRSIYFFIKRSKLIPSMVLFDWPEHLVSIGRRSQTTIAPQSLMFLNSPLVRGYARGFAGRLKVGSPEDVVKNAFEIAFSRLPNGPELQRSIDFLNQQSRRYQA
eukprot:g21982.t1